MLSHARPLLSTQHPAPSTRHPAPSTQHYNPPVSSIFFTGFDLPLDQLTAPVRWVSYLVPGTYGIGGLQDVVFRGQMAEPALMGGLGLYAAVMAALAWLSLRRDVEPVRA